MRLSRVCHDLTFLTVFLINHHAQLRSQHPAIPNSFVSSNKWHSLLPLHSFAFTGPSVRRACSIFLHLKNPYLVLKMPLRCNFCLGPSLDAVKIIFIALWTLLHWTLTFLYLNLSTCWYVCLLIRLWLLQRSVSYWLSILPASTLSHLIFQ